MSTKPGELQKDSGHYRRRSWPGARLCPIAAQSHAKQFKQADQVPAQPPGASDPRHPGHKIDGDEGLQEAFAGPLSKAMQIRAQWIAKLVTKIIVAILAAIRPVSALKAASQKGTSSGVSELCAYRISRSMHSHQLASLSPALQRSLAYIELTNASASIDSCTWPMPAGSSRPRGSTTKTSDRPGTRYERQDALQGLHQWTAKKRMRKRQLSGNCRVYIYYNYTLLG